MKLFISYAHVNKWFCDEIVKYLDAHDAWYDQNLKGGQKWWDTILQHLVWCEGFIYLLSPASVNSEYCQKEVELARTHGKRIIPVLIEERTEIPSNLRDIQYVDLTKGLNDAKGIASLLNAILEAERVSQDSSSDLDLENLDDPAFVPPIVEKQHSIRKSNLRYNYVYNFNRRKIARSGEAPKEATKRAYYMWLCRFLEYIAGQEPVPVDQREGYLSDLPLDLLINSLSVPQVKSWFGIMIADGQKTLSSAKAAILTLAELLAEDNHIPTELVHKLKAINISNVSDPSYEPRRLAEEEIRRLIDYSHSQLYTNRNIRDAVVITLSLVLRTRDIADAVWSQLFMLNNKWHFKRQNGSPIILPKSSQHLIDIWRTAVLSSQIEAEIRLDSPIVRQVMKNDQITERRIEAQRAGKIVAAVAKEAGLGILSTDSLRMSVHELRRNIDLLF